MLRRFTLIASLLALGSKASAHAQPVAEGTRRSDMVEDSSGFAAARQQVRAALAAIGSGDPEPYIQCWAEHGDVTLFGARGPIERGLARVTETFRWVGRRFRGGGTGGLVPEDSVAFASGDLGYTVGFERGEVVVDGGPPRPMVIRVTHIYRRLDGAWRLVHRHADFPPAEDPRKSG
jgi:ketosteroid isomerase-like protein